MRFYLCRWTFLEIIILLLGELLAEIKGIKITKVNIPSVVRSGTPDDVILDCIYDLQNSSTKSLVIKWFVNGDILYQWIAGKEPKGSTELQKYVDASYNASSDESSKYRAVKLVRPGHELTGNVKCSISSHGGEAHEERRMLVYSPAKRVKIFQPQLNLTSNELRVSCVAEDIYPKPTVTLKRDTKPLENQHSTYKNMSDGLYTVETSAILQADKYPLPVPFICEVSIPEANYTALEVYLFNGSDANRISVLLVIIAQVVILAKY